MRSEQINKNYFPQTECSTLCVCLVAALFPMTEGFASCMTRISASMHILQ
jgi:hypothetical protein